MTDTTDTTTTENTENESFLPTDLSVGDEDVEAASARAVLSEGWYQFVISSAERHVNEETKDLSILTLCSPLEEINNLKTQTQPNVVYMIPIPIRNPRSEGHKVKDADKKTWRLLNLMRTLDNAFVDYPRKVGSVLIYKGVEIDQENYDTAKKEVNKTVLDRAVNVFWKDPQSLVNEAFFAEVVHNGNYVNIRNLCSELPADAKLVAPENFRTNLQAA